MADRTTPKKQGKSGDAREERLKAALKANMARRKAQAKARAASEDKSVKDEG
ncbi:hypothetical protein [Ruegeria profundi]|uniref:hypothetical protein n=1 Tax=Ruegeria profundi TaxID=1685378 RepID=UPI001CD238F0|nr:hypothetical protein [Ruegeria profundi]MCA0930368.1 hypothetical protein [Ruegeria profundi]